MVRVPFLANGMGPWIGSHPMPLRLEHLGRTCARSEVMMVRPRTGRTRRGSPGTPRRSHAANPAATGEIFRSASRCNRAAKAPLDPLGAKNCDQGGGSVMTQAPTHSDFASRNQRGITVPGTPGRIPCGRASPCPEHRTGSTGTPEGGSHAVLFFCPVSSGEGALQADLEVHLGADFVVDMPVPTSKKCHQLQERPLCRGCPPLMATTEWSWDRTGPRAPTQHHPACQQENTNDISAGMPYLSGAARPPCLRAGSTRGP